MKTKNSALVNFATLQGLRMNQEDRYVAGVIQGKGRSGHLLAVMDGHGGSYVADFCANNLARFFQLGDPEHPRKALEGLISRLNETTHMFREGSTISVAYVLEERNEVWAAVLGDSPIVVIDKIGKVYIGPNHNVRTNMAERSAAEKRGGRYDGKYIRNSDGTGLQLTRALGDSQMAGIVSREPEIFAVNDPVWVAVASDGMLDPAHRDKGSSLNEFVSFGKASAGAEELMSWANGHVLDDNATVVVWKG